MEFLKTLYDATEKEWSGSNDFKVDVSRSYGECLLNALQKHGDQLIQINHDTGYQMTCREMRLKSLKIAQRLSELGIQVGDHIMIIAEHRDDLVSIFIGILIHGAAVNPLHSNFSIADISYFCDLVKPKLIICDEANIDKIKKSLEDTHQISPIYAFTESNEKAKSVSDLVSGYETDPATFIPPNLGDLSTAVSLIICSSGTTGLPKCVMVSHAMALYGLIKWWYVPAGHMYFSASFFYWITSILGISSCILHRLPRIITAQAITADLLLDILEKYKVQHVFMDPPLLAAVVKRLAVRACDLSSLELIETAGCILSETVCAATLGKIPLVTIVSIYGMTDVGGCIAYSLKGDSAGALLPSVRAKIINEEGIRLGTGEIGEICLKKPVPLLGYLDNKAATTASMDVDQWFLTGDIGYFDADHALHLIDRKKDMIKYRGFHIAPSELEQYIEKNFDLLGVVVVGIPDDEVIFLPAAAVVAKPNSSVTPSDISKAIEEHFGDAKKLRGGVYFVQHLPRTSSGKIQRNLVRKMVGELYEAEQRVN